ncbi:MAG TPA: hypothetical protein PKJ33_00060 [Alphaproteobacteria bacterium]|mgnify:CR=1 FL=1|nr:hypothetical protein [Alphaproteobacteria bacterium]
MKLYGSIFTTCFLATALVLSYNPANAAVVQRGSVTARAAPRANNAMRIASTTTTNDTVEATDTTVAELETTDTAIADANVIENKSSKFDSVLGDVGSNSMDVSAKSRTQMIMDQRAALDASDTQSTSKKVVTTAGSTCDTNLRNCMKQKCNNDFSKCSGDGDTDWGNKINSCRATSNCSSEEFNLFADEIKADRDYNSEMANYNQTIDCGNRYNSCIISQCGTDFSKCLSKSVADAAVLNCTKIATDCQSADNGLTSRAQEVFGTLRNNAVTQTKKDEDRLYELRNLMTEQCKSFGASFDERSLDCVFTVNLFANNSKTPMASKKLYAGDTFDCNQDWFGIDLTTYKENAYRLTRSQTAASSAMLGAGLGVAAGAISSGAISHAIDTHKAEKALDAAKENSNSSSNNESGLSSVDGSSMNKTNTETETSSKIDVETNRDQVLKDNAKITGNNAEAMENMDKSRQDYETAKKNNDMIGMANAEANMHAEGSKVKEMEHIEVSSTPSAPEKIDASKLLGGSK